MKEHRVRAKISFLFLLSLILALTLPHVKATLPWTDTTLVLYHQYNEGTGTTTYDATAYGHNGYLCPNSTDRPTWTTGHESYGLDYDGINDYVNITKTTALNFTSQDMTVSFWSCSTYVNSGVFVGSGYWMTDGWYIQWFPTYSITFVTCQAGAGQYSYTYQNVVSNNVWFFCAVTRTGASAKIYINGVDRTQVSATHVNPLKTTKNVTIGAYGSPLNTWFDGIIDEVRIYNRTLTNSELLALYLGGVNDWNGIPIVPSWTQNTTNLNWTSLANVPSWVMNQTAYNWTSLANVPSWVANVTAYNWTALALVPSWVMNITNYDWTLLAGVPDWVMNATNLNWTALALVPSWTMNSTNIDWSLYFNMTGGNETVPAWVYYWSPDTVVYENEMTVPMIGFIIAVVLVAILTARRGVTK